MNNRSLYFPYTPIKPLFLDGSKESLEVACFYNYERFSSKYKKAADSAAMNSEERNHLLWLHATLLSKETQMLCPYCKARTVKYFGHHQEFALFENYYYCEVCVEYELPKKVYSKKLSLGCLGSFNITVIRSYILPVLRRPFEIPKRISNENAFNFFLKDSKPFLFKKIVPVSFEPQLFRGTCH